MAGHTCQFNRLEFIRATIQFQAGGWSAGSRGQTVIALEPCGQEWGKVSPRNAAIQEVINSAPDAELSICGQRVNFNRPIYALMHCLNLRRVN